MFMAKSPIVMNLRCCVPGLGPTCENSKIIKIHLYLREGAGYWGSSLMMVPRMDESVLIRCTGRA